MENPIDFSGKPFHFIGIGGIGMSAIAHILTRQDLPVSGSDIRSSHITERLQSEGAHIFVGQGADNLRFFQSYPPHPLPAVDALPSTPGTGEPGSASGTLPQVVCSSAISASNPEYSAALQMGCSIYHRSDVLAALLNNRRGIAVAGTHGKTTTSSLVGYVLLKAGLDPSIVVGGEVEAWDGNARLGHGDYLVAEADESDGSLVKFAPEVGVITNIELDHPDHYASLDAVVDIFQTFARRCKVLVACQDCGNIRRYLKADVTYSIQANRSATYWADDIVYCHDGTQAQIWERGEVLGTLWLPMLGAHNLSNALAAIAVARQAGVEFRAIVDALQTFKGARRRFEVYGEHRGILFIDDYAHHPSEIQATLAAAKLHSRRLDGHGRRRVIAVFQPHRYSRATLFREEFSRSFGDADVVISTNVYSAGEQPGAVDGQGMADAIADQHPHVFYQSTLEDVSEFLKKTLVSSDLVIFLGAGNLNQVIPSLMEHYQQPDVAEMSTSLLSQVAS